ncbi:MAG: hypothetical protein GXX99_01965 [Clostridiales bacterium]|nr:hypothetical protein [Clostridiales bacterium]
MAQMAGWGAPVPGQEAPSAEIPAPLPVVDEDFRRRRRLGELRAKLSSAVALEQYEEAARLRDEITRSEKEACTHES